MKKIRLLQILVYIVFGLFILQNAGDDMYRGFKHGFEDYDKDISGNGLSSGPIRLTILNAGLMTGNGTDTMTIDGKYRLKDMVIQTNIAVDDPGQKPWWLIVTGVVLIMVTLYLFYKIASTVNQIISNIYNGTMFNRDCIKLIQKTGIMIIVFAMVDYAYQWFDYTEQTIAIQSPLKVVNTLSFSLGTILCAIFIFIIAEAFKQGSRLKEEQELNI